MDKNYIRKQLTRYESATNPQQADDCLYRIGSNADVLQPGEQLNDGNRQRILQFIASLR